ncbi:MAG: hypothetical protein V2I67_18590 [Thermoanaerobaculales bacterium]|jgi:hypothetical protein|nr:hypothetical protein [Thermoanaerobaculales bacterium]
MKRKTRIQLAALVSAAVVVGAGCGSDAPDESLVEDLGSLMPGEPVVPQVAEKAPDNVTVLFADDVVHVSRIILRSGESIPVIEAGHRVYFLAMGTAELAVEDETESLLIRLNASDVHYVEPGVVSMTNVGDLPIELIEVARTPVMLPEFLETRVAEARFDNPVLYDNDWVRVHEMTVEPGSTIDLHPAPIRVVLPMNECDLEYRTVEDEVVVIPGGPSNPYARPGDDVSVSNPGDDAVTFVVFDWLM